MSPSRIALAAGIGLVIVAVIWGLVSRGSDEPGPAPPAGPAAPAGEASAERRINATLYFVSEDGMSLVGVQREVTFGDTALEQARHIVEAQLGPPPAPLGSAIPPGAALRGLYVTETGEAFVDLNAAARTNHTGGSIDELFTVYAIVDALTVNLPAIKRVQILVEGKEVDTLAGHVDLRHPLQQNLQWVRSDQP